MICVVVCGLAAPFSAFAHGVVVTIRLGKVRPAEVTLRAGDTVKFLSEDDQPGGYTVVADDGSFESPPILRGGSWHRRFDRPGLYIYFVRERPLAIGLVHVVAAGRVVGMGEDEQAEPAQPVR